MANYTYAFSIYASAKIVYTLCNYNENKTLKVMQYFSDNYKKYYSGDEESGFCISGKHLTLKKIQQILSK